MTPAFGPLAYWLADYYAMATCVLIPVGLSLLGLRQPARRLAVCGSALGGLLALLALGLIPSWPRTSLVNPSTRAGRARPSTDGISAAIALEGVGGAISGRAGPMAESLGGMRLPPAEGPPSRNAGTFALSIGPAATPAPMHLKVEASLADRPLAWPSLVSGTFLAGVVLMGGWLALGSWQTAALRRRSSKATGRLKAMLSRVVDAGHAAPELLISRSLRHPVAVGVLRPAIILPERFIEADPEDRLEATLAHEWAHVRNRDLWLIALLRLLLPVLYAHPAYWWLRRRIRDDQEALADASAAGAEGRLNYAEALLSWSMSASGRPPFAAGGALALFERSSQIKRRIVMLLDPSFRVETTCPARWNLAARVGMALAVLGISLITLRPSAVGSDAPGIAGSPADPATAEVRAGATDDPDDSAHLLDPGGQPFSGAKVYISEARNGLKGKSKPPTLLGTTGPDGAFRYPRPADADARSRPGTRLVAMADGYGPALADPFPREAAKVVKLVKDDVPIRGRVLDIQGRPVAGATARVVGLLWHPSGKLDEWLEKLEVEKTAYEVEYRMLRSWSNDDLSFHYPPVVTDGTGRFTLQGIGRERIASLLISGPGIETTFAYVATRLMPTVKVPDFPRQNFSNHVIYHGADFDLVVGPCLESVGTVTDKDTGKPLVGVTVQTAALLGNPLRALEATTDDRGRYRLAGIPPKTKFNDEQELLASIEDGPPYLPAIKHIGKGDGVNPITIDFQLKRGVWARGRVVEKSTGKGVHASLSYFILEDNPYLKTYPRYGTVRAGMPFSTDEDGAFRLVVMPGRGVIGARVGNEHYRLGVGVDTIEGLKPVDDNRNDMIPTRPFHLTPKSYHTLIGIDPREGDESVACEIALDRGRVVVGKVVGPDGEPLAGARIEGLQDYYRFWSHEPLPSAEFLVEGIGPGAERDLLAYHEEKKLAGAYTIKADAAGPITVALVPCGAVTGRLVDAGGLPLGEVELTCPGSFGGIKQPTGSLPSPIRTDKDGRFLAEGLVPGRRYTFCIWDATGVRRVVRDAVEAAVSAGGETKDLGDVTVKGKANE